MGNRVGSNPISRTKFTEVNLYHSIIQLEMSTRFKVKIAFERVLLFYEEILMLLGIQTFPIVIVISVLNREEF